VLRSPGSDAADAVARTLFLWTLVILMPLTSLRMICVDHSVRAAGRAAVFSPTECDEMCPRDGAPLPENDRPENECLLVAGGCSAVTTFLVALPAPALAIAPPLPTIYADVRPPLTYLGPVVRPFSPPPER
jgi:hypothetical protein